MIRIIAILVCFQLLAACDGYPRDPKGSLRAAQNQVLKVGASEFSPWVRWENGNATGIEAELVENFARSIGTRVEWITGSEGMLMTMLEAHELHLVVGGITADSPWKKRVALTRPYRKQHYLICSTDENLSPRTLKNQKVALYKDSPLGAQIKDKDGIPERLNSLENYRGLIVIAADERDRYPCGQEEIRLKPSEHVMALPMGENALLMAVEKFLQGVRR
jgi:Bacterial extracellular solute-binding proteins, family 3.